MTQPDPWVTIAERIEAARVRADISKRELARRARVTEGHVRPLLQGYRTVDGNRVRPAVSPATLAAVAYAAGIDPAELFEVVGFDWEPEKFPPPAEEVSDLELLRQEVQEIRQGLAEVRGRLDEVSSTMTGLERQLAPQPRKGRRAAGNGGR